MDRTFLGHHFLSAFNTWYYSWAPSVARVESGNRELSAAVRMVIIPLLGTLYLSSVLFDWLYFINPEFAVLLSGVVASTLLGVVYLTPIALTMLYSMKRRIRRTTIAKIILMGLLLTLVGTLSHGRTDVFENLTALTVIEAALLSSTLVAMTIQTIICRRQLCRDYVLSASARIIFAGMGTNESVVMR